MTSEQPSAAPVALSGQRAALGLLGVALALLLALAGCDEEPVELQQAAVEVPDASPLLYEIASPDGKIEGWLLGTIHALPDRVAWRTPEIDEAIAKADYLVVEVATLDDTSEISEIFTRLSDTPELPDITYRVAPSLRGDLSAMIARSNHDSGSFSYTEDWAAAIMLAQVDAPGKPEFGVDRAVIEAFAGRPVRGLETAEQQLRIFDDLAPADQTDLLEGTVRDWAAAREDPDKLVRAWLNGDIAVLEEASDTGIMADPELREALLVGRNERWIAMLLPFLERDAKPLIAVGTAHIVGEDGLPAMLEARGYTVRLIEVPRP